MSIKAITPNLKQIHWEWKKNTRTFAIAGGGGGGGLTWNQYAYYR